MIKVVQHNRGEVGNCPDLHRKLRILSNTSKYAIILHDKLYITDGVVALRIDVGVMSRSPIAVPTRTLEAAYCLGVDNVDTVEKLLVFSSNEYELITDVLEGPDLIRHFDVSNHQSGCVLPVGMLRQELTPLNQYRDVWRNTTIAPYRLLRLLEPYSGAEWVEVCIKDGSSPIVMFIGSDELLLIPYLR